MQWSNFGPAGHYTPQKLAEGGDRKQWHKEEEAGWGLVSVKASNQDESNKNSEYFRKVVLGEKILNEDLRQQKPDGEQLEPPWEDQPRHDI